MKKTLFAAAATACTLSSAAFAQSSTVTLYGVADAGVSYQSHVNGGTNRQGSIAALSSGGLSGSRWASVGWKTSGVT